MASEAAAVLDRAEIPYWSLNDWEAILYHFVQACKGQISDLLRILVSWILIVSPAVVFMDLLS